MAQKTSAQDQTKKPYNPNFVDEETCSLTRAFDEFIMCYSIGSQAVNYYRYGTYKDCSKKYDDFKFCLSVKSKPKDVQARMMEMRRQQKQMEKRIGPNSEDVWKLRTEPIPNYPPTPKKTRV